MDIGSLTGDIALDDELTSGLDLAGQAVQKFADQFDGAFGAIVATIGVGVAAIGAMTGAVVALGNRGADVNDVAATLEHFAGSAAGADAILEKMQAGVLGTVDKFTLMKDSSRLLSAGVKLTADDFGTLSEAAFDLQNRGLGSTKDMLDLVSDAMVTGRTKALSLKLGVIDVGDAEENYAKTLHTTKDLLSDAGKAEAHRIAVMGLLTAATKDAGQQQRDFGEQIEFVKTKVIDWVDKLASAVAVSPNVTRAMDTIGKSLSDAFGGDGQAALETIVGWVNSFADAVSSYGPSIISTIVDIKDVIVDVWHTVTEAWNIVPDWFKNIARDAALAGGAVYLASSVIAATGPDLLGMTANLATITSGTQSLTQMMTAAFPVLTAYKVAVVEAATAFIAITGPIGAVIIAIAAVTATLYAGIEAWKLWREEGERADAQKKQDAVDTENLARINKATGQSFTDLGQAVEYARKFSADLRGENSGLVQEYGPTIEQLTKTSKGMIDQGAVAKKLAEAQKALKDALAEQASLSKPLTDGQIQQILKLEAINALSSSQIALIAGVTEAQLKKFDTDQALIKAGNKLQDVQFGLINTTDMLTDSELRNIAQGQQYFKQYEEFLALLRKVKELEDLTASARLAGGGFGADLTGIGFKSSELSQVEELVRKAGEQSGMKFKTALATSIEDVPGLIISSLTGGGGLVGALQAIGSSFGTNIGTNLKNSLTDSMTKGGEKAIGALAKGMLGALPLIGSIVGPLIGLLSKIGGPSAAELDARKAQDTLVKQLQGIATQAQKTEGALTDSYHTIAIVGRDAFLQVGYSATQADKMVQELLNTHDPALYKQAADALAAAQLSAQGVATAVTAVQDAAKALGRSLPEDMQASIESLMTMNGLTNEQRASLQGVLDAAKPNYAQLTSMASEYGITLEGLGPKFQQANIDATAKKYYDSFTELTRAGGDAGGVLLGMSDEILDLVTHSRDFGVAIPDNMKPLIESLMNSTDLSEDFKKKLGEMKDIAFEATPLDEGLKGLEEALNRLTATLQALPGQAAAAAGGMRDAFRGGIVATPDFASSGGTVTPDGISYYASGGNVLPFVPRGTDTVPAMLTPGETVVSVKDTRSQAEGISDLQIGQDNTNKKLDKIQRLLQDQPRAIAVAVDDVVALKQRRVG